jgi:hypothetical protein
MRVSDCPVVVKLSTAAACPGTHLPKATQCVAGPAVAPVQSRGGHLAVPLCTLVGPGPQGPPGPSQTPSSDPSPRGGHTVSVRHGPGCTGSQRLEARDEDSPRLGLHRDAGWEVVVAAWKDGGG